MNLWANNNSYITIEIYIGPVFLENIGNFSQLFSLSQQSYFFSYSNCKDTTIRCVYKDIYVRIYEIKELINWQ